MISYDIISYDTISYHIISYHIILYYIISYHYILCHIISYHMISYCIISYHIISYHTISYHITSYHKIIYYCIIFLFLVIQERIAHPPLLVLSTSTQVTSHISVSQNSTQQHLKLNQIKSIHLLFKSNGDSYSINSSCKLFRNSISLCLYCLLIFRFKVCDNIFIFLHYVYVSLRYCFQLLLSFASPFHLILLCAIISTLL